MFKKYAPTINTEAIHPNTSIAIPISIVDA